MSEEGSESERAMIFDAENMRGSHEDGKRPVDGDFEDDYQQVHSQDGLQLSVSSASFSASELTSDSLSGSDYIPISGHVESGEEGSVRDRRRIIRQINGDLRRNILSSLKVDIAAASAKLFVTMKILSRSFCNLQDALRDLQRGKENLRRIEDASKSLMVVGRQVLPNWQS